MHVEAMRQEELSSFRKYKDEFKVVFDVGARGNLEFIDIHPNCEYHLFEPQKTYADHLKEATKDKFNVHVNHCGLSDEPAKAQKFYTNVESFYTTSIPKLYLRRRRLRLTHCIRVLLGTQDTTNRFLEDRYRRTRL